MKHLLLSCLLLFPLATEAQSDEVTCLATVIHNEAKHTTLTERKRVAEVVLNRVKKKTYGRDLCDVTEKKGQFNDTRVSPTAPQWKENKRLAAAILSGETGLPRTGSLYFHSGSSTPSWVKRKSKTVRTQYHQYYK